MVRVLIASLDYLLLLIIIDLVWILSHECVLIWRADCSDHASIVVRRLVFAIDLNFWRFTIRICEVLYIFDFAVSVTWYIWVIARTHTGLKNISCLFSPSRQFFWCFCINLVNQRRHYYLDKLRIAHARKILLFSTWVMPYRLLHSTRIRSHV